MSAPITLYTRTGCPHCRLAREYLNGKGVPFQERDVSKDQAALAELRRINAPIVPVIMIEREAILGFDRVRLDDLLRTKGVTFGKAGPAGAR
jgi:glutaredoxin